MLVKDIMTSDVVTVKPTMGVQELAQLFVEKEISGAPVVDDKGALRGVVLEESLILQDKNIHLPTFFFILSGFITLGEHQFEEEMKKVASTNVEGIMERAPKTLSPDTPVEDVATLIVEHGVHYFPVVEAGKLVGVVTKKDLVRAIAQKKIW